MCVEKGSTIYILVLCTLCMYHVYSNVYYVDVCKYNLWRYVHVMFDFIKLDAKCRTKQENRYKIRVKRFIRKLIFQDNIVYNIRSTKALKELQVKETEHESTFSVKRIILLLMRLPYI